MLTRFASRSLQAALEQEKKLNEKALQDAQRKFENSEHNASVRHNDAAAQAKSLADRSHGVDQTGTASSVASTVLGGGAMLARGAAWAAGAPI